MTEPASPLAGVIVRAENGDVIGFDETGLTLRLSDRVIADIAARLELPASEPQSAEQAAPALPDLPEDLDLWAVRREGDWIAFQANLPGADGPRGYRRHLEGGAIVAESRGPLFALLGIGGARAALASPGPGRFPYHVFAPADDIGAVGMGGDGEAPATALLQQLSELTHEALLAECLLARRVAAQLSLPLFFVRAETDRAATSVTFGTSTAMANFDRALGNLVAAATRLGTRAQVLAVTLDYVIEDVSGDPIAYRDGMTALMERMTRSLAKHGLARPVFLAAFDCGTQDISSGPALDGQWELSWNHADHQLVFTGPSYAFPLDDTGRLTDEGRRAKADLAATALLAMQENHRWLCPTIQLAERVGTAIRLICEAMDPLEIDPTDPFGAGPLAGFRLEGETGGAKIKSVKIDPKDRKVVLLTCTKRPEGADLHVAYAHGAKPGPGPYPANKGALRDSWGMDGQHRWALPARLRVTDGAL
jgi:hypothetical protein